MNLSIKTAGLVQVLALCCSAAMESPVGRRLASFEPIAEYTPVSLVTHFNAMDLEVNAIKRELHLGARTGYRNAERLYREGAFSKSVAEIITTEPIDDNNRAKIGMEVIGLSHGDGDKEVRGKLLELRDDAGSSTLLVEYMVSDDQDDYLGCQVGGNPTPTTGGCFQEVGTLAIPDLDLSFDYRYNVLYNNLNLLSISKLSSEARNSMHECEDCYYFPMYSKFREYYGRYDYADHIVTSAFHQGRTDMDAGSMNFAVYAEDGRTEIIIKTITYMSVWMHVIREMERALDQCNSQNSLTEEDPWGWSWDRAVAFYTGSTQSPDGAAGTMLYELADRACSTMHTCLEDSMDGTTAYVNHYIFKQFTEGQRKLLDGNCDEAKTHKNHIATLMTIPLIQRTLRYAHMIADETSIGEYDEKHAAQGAVYALSVLPLVHSCSPDDARIIYDNLKPSRNPNVDFAAVKNAFERNYNCLGVLCSEIGGVWNGEEYLRGASPCDDSMLLSNDILDTRSSDIKTDSKDSNKGLLVVLIVVGLVIVGLLLVLVVRTGACRKSDVELDTGKGSRGGLPDERPSPDFAEHDEEETTFHTEVEVA